jgi:hypothetical protein
MKLAFFWGPWLGLLAACSQNHEPAVPRPSERQVLQIYVLASADAGGILGSPQFPSADALSSSLAVRIERKEVASVKEAEETLKVWNARPVDLLFLGSGFAQTAWQQTKLAKAASKLTVFWQTPKPVPGALAVSVDWRAAQDLLLQFSELQTTCRIEPPSLAKIWSSLCKKPGARLLAAGHWPGAWVNVSVKWADLLVEIVRRKNSALAEGQVILVDPRSALLEIRPGEAMTRNEQKAFEEKHRTWMLNHL